LRKATGDGVTEIGKQLARLSVSLTDRLNADVVQNYNEQVVNLEQVREPF